MKIGLTILVLGGALALSGCETTTVAASDGKPSVERTISNISPEAQAVMTARKLPLSALFRGTNDCYAIEVEVTTPRSGVALRRADGTQICD